MGAVGTPKDDFPKLCRTPGLGPTPSLLSPGCSRLPIECAHVRTGTDGGLALKPSDKWTISLCQFHHLEQHAIGERNFEAKYDLDLQELAREFAKLSPHQRRFALG